MLNTSPLQITDFSEIIDILFESENIFQSAGTAFSKASDMFGIIQADIRHKLTGSQNHKRNCFCK